MCVCVPGEGNKYNLLHYKCIALMASNSVANSRAKELVEDYGNGVNLNVLPANRLSLFSIKLKR